MATAQQTIRSMQSLKEDFATAGSVAGLFRLRVGRDPQRTAALRRREAPGSRSPGPSWLGQPRKRPGA